MNLKASFLTIFGLFGVCNAAISDDVVSSLPGWEKPLLSKVYSGFLEIDPNTGKNLHYVYIEAEGKGSDDVVMWLNGGPGCSSLDGWLYENGPYTLNPNNYSQLLVNEHRWTQAANMLWLEAPAGVGFSYSKTTQDYITNDTRTADDNFAALNMFFEGFPELSEKNFYISGESYAGVYIPTLANRIRIGNEKGESSINLKGILVGNGCTGNDVGTCSAQGTNIRINYLYSHGLFSTKLYNNIESTCTDFVNPSSECQSLLSEMGDEIGKINIYDIYGECIFGPSSYGKLRVPTPVTGPDECINSNAAHAYLNSVDVQKALNVYDAAQWFGTWFICSSKLDYTSTATDLPKNVYPALVENYRVLIYNGDADACVPYTDNEEWTSGMGYDVSTPWHPWMVNGQVGGYATDYKTSGSGSFAFITIHGAGHMVPQFRPEAAYYFFTKFLSNEPL